MRACLCFIALLGLAATLAGCAGRGGAGPMPDDLLVTYEWREGSLPPPYHYEYSISLQADGAGEVIMIPDYPGEGVPVWAEPFTVPRTEVERLYALMVEQGLFSQRWRELDDPPVGGSSEDLTVVAGGRTVAIPAFLPPVQQERAELIYTALREAVPPAIFGELEARREAYAAEREGQ